MIGSGYKPDSSGKAVVQQKVSVEQISDPVTSFHGCNNIRSRLGPLPQPLPKVYTFCQTAHGAIIQKSLILKEMHVFLLGFAM